MRWLWALGLMLAACGRDDGGFDPPAPPGPNPQVQAPAVDFGQVVVGESTVRDLVVRNGSGTQFVNITAYTAPTNGVTIVGNVPILPLAIGPGQELRLRLSFAPRQEGAFEQPIEFRNGQETVAATRIEGEGVSSEIVRDFGAVPVSAAGRSTGELQVVLPPDAISLTIEVEAGVNDFLVPLLLEGPGGRVYVDPRDPWAGPYVFERNFPGTAVPGSSPVRFAPFESARFQLPNSDDGRVQLVPGGGTYRFRIGVVAGAATTVKVKAVVERRSQPLVGHVDVNVFLAPGLGRDGDDPGIREVLDDAEAILAPAGLSFGEVEFHDLADDAFDVIETWDDLERLFAESARAPGKRLNVFLVVSLGGYSGLSGGQPGGREKGSPYSGVAVGFWQGAGLDLAHEIGHYLGLEHTVEYDASLPWTHDNILDTVECPTDGSTSATCPVFGADLLMHPGPVAHPKITPGQAFVIQRHVLVEPGSGR